MAAFVTLCEAYMGTEPDFNLWNYFFHAWLRQGLDMEAELLGGVDIYVWSGPKVDPYFLIPMPDPLIKWRRAWFLLRQDANMPLPVFMGSCPIPYPS
jgi:hypothetical protein